MKKILIISLLLIIQFFPSHSDNILKFEDLIKRNSLFFKKFSNIPFSGKVEGQFNQDFLGEFTYSKGYFKNGKRSGDWEFYFTNGNLKSKGKFVDNIRVGKWEFYTSSGDYIGDGFYGSKGQLIEGVSVIYGNKKISEVISIQRYKKGKKNGSYHLYRSNGFLEMKGFYKNDKKEGRFTNYWGNRGGKNKLNELMYKNGTLLWVKSYNENGLLIKVTKYNKSINPQNWSYTFCTYEIKFKKSEIDGCYLNERYNDQVISQPLDILDYIK